MDGELSAAHRKCVLRDLSEDDFKKCRRHPKGKEVAKKTFGYFSFLKSDS